MPVGGIKHLPPSPYFWNEIQNSRKEENIPNTVKHSYNGLTFGGQGVSLSPMSAADKSKGVITEEHYRIDSHNSCNKHTNYVGVLLFEIFFLTIEPS
jgi:hypothetical protein